MIVQLRDNPFSLILSGGGALGIVHLGILHDLEQENLVHKVDEIRALGLNLLKEDYVP